MILQIKSAHYVSDYKIQLTFNSGEIRLTDLKEYIFSKEWEIVKPLRNINYFKKFHPIGSTIGWSNDFDLSPEFLYKISKTKRSKAKFILPA